MYVNNLRRNLELKASAPYVRLRLRLRLRRRLRFLFWIAHYII